MEFAYGPYMQALKMQPPVSPLDRAIDACIARANYYRKEMALAHTPWQRARCTERWRESRLALAVLLSQRTLLERAMMSGRRILLVEDDTDVSLVLCDMLSADGYVTERVETAQQALQKAGKSRPDLVLVDIGLPDQNGLYLARKLSDRFAVPIVVITAQPSFVMDEPLGANPCIKSVVFKPCSRRTLLAAVQEALAGT